MRAGAAIRYVGLTLIQVMPVTVPAFSISAHLAVQGINDPISIAADFTVSVIHVKPLATTHSALKCL
jgi:hypothetical protein